LPHPVSRKCGAGRDRVVTGDKTDLIQYRIQRAFETLNEAQVLADAGKWNACVNRLYYACFYAVSALILKKDLSSAKHTGVKSLFNLYFVKPGIVPKEYGKMYNRLFERRQEGDYLDFFDFDEEKVRPWFDWTKEFIGFIAGLLE